MKVHLVTLADDVAGRDAAVAAVATLSWFDRCVLDGGLGGLDC